MIRLTASLLAVFACVAEPLQPVAPHDPALKRVSVIGASVSAGYRLRTNLALALHATMAHDGVEVVSHAQPRFFLAPLSFGDDAVEAALDEKPTLVLAVDYLFWFGYGTVGADGAPIKTEEDRLKLLEVGLKYLERLDCPILVGDFPDMSPSIGERLLKVQMPKAETLAKLNERFHAWAAKHENVVVLPLAKFVGDMREGQPIKIGEHTFTVDEIRHWMQRDRLHTTDEGLVALSLLVDETLVEHKLAAAGDFTFDPKSVLDKVRATYTTTAAR